MRISTFAPSARLASVVEKLSIVETPYEVSRALLPDLAPIVGVRFAGAASEIADARITRLPDASLAGVRGTVRHMRTHANSGVVLAHFRPGCAPAVFGVPMHELFGATVALDALLGRAAAARLVERVTGAADHHARVAILDAALVERIGAFTPDSLVSAAVTAITRARGSLRIADVADQLDISQDPLEKRFRSTVGTSPKHFASLVRITHAIELAKHGGRLARIAHAAGYFDQSHFNRDFRAVTGTSPTTFFNAAAFC
ncbi:MAG: helix-turn-helix transcriptional regulator [Kofleriaceae bacterium]